MWLMENGLKVYLCLGYTDMRKSVNGLSVFVSEVLECDPFSGHLFVFSNRRRKILKTLYWDRNGFSLWYKRLEKDRFRWPMNEGDVLEIGFREFRWLLDGLGIDQVGAYGRLEYGEIY